jgi:hypothetical protein
MIARNAATITIPGIVNSAAGRAMHTKNNGKNNRVKHGDTMQHDIEARINIAPNKQIIAIATIAAHNITTAITGKRQQNASDGSGIQSQHTITRTAGIARHTISGSNTQHIKPIQ